MDITIDDDQMMLRDTALSFAQKALTPAAIRALEATEHRFDTKIWRQMAEMGWAGAAFPEEYGGSGTGLLELALIIEALGQAALPSPIFSTVVEAGLLLLDAGSPAQRRTYLPRIAAGDSILTTAIIEPSGGLAARDIRTRITPAGNRFTVNGTKLFVRDAGVAEAIICLGRSGKGETDLALADYNQAIVINPSYTKAFLNRATVYYKKKQYDLAIGDLNAAYRAHPALHVGDCEPIGFRWLVGDDRDGGVLAFLRTGGEADPPICVVANFTPVPREGYRLGVPRAGFWKEILSSDSVHYGGSGVGNRGGMHSDGEPCRGFEQSLVVTVPPLGIAVFVAQ